jgi:hypothetical protein
MRTQVQEQGRYLGGRPPYGYCLIDAGPHPNRAHARWGRRLHRFDPDPRTAEHVRWIFAERVKARSVAGIVRELNTSQVPCPSVADTERNRHRHGGVWRESTVASILANPRYTGYQAWNRQPTDHTAVTTADMPAGESGTRRHEDGRLPIQRWAPTSDWVISQAPSHPALVSTETFLAVQALHTDRPDQHGRHRTYRLAGFLYCGLCGRKMDAHWVNNRPGYRCRHGRRTSTQLAGQPYLYAREDEVVTLLGHEPGLSQFAQAPDALVAALDHQHMIIECSVNAGRLSIHPCKNGPDI